MHDLHRRQQRSILQLAWIIVPIALLLFTVRTRVQLLTPDDGVESDRMSAAAAESGDGLQPQSPPPVDSLSDQQVDSLLATLATRFAAAGQGHVTAFVDELSLEQKRTLAFDLSQLRVDCIADDWAQVQAQTSATANMANAATAKSTDADKPEQHITPFYNVSTLATTPAETRQRWTSLGLQLLAEGKVAALLMAGGQGTRLGSAEPKGCYDIGLQSHKSLFQIQAERLLRLRQLAASHAHRPVAEVHIRWYIMTSIITHQATRAYFAANSYFGLPAADIFFFQQSELPALDLNGKILMERKDKVSLAPNGNGGIFEGLKRQGALDDMEKHGISYIHVYGVDNVLARVGDPTFMGFGAALGADCANKVVLKTEPTEKVGVMCLRDGRPSVVEYSELPQAMSVMRSEASGQLLYSAGNIVQHFFTFEFLRSHADFPLPYHVAHKVIPCVDASTGTPVVPVVPNGVKLEMFVFDAFERARNMQALAVERDDEFSPVKNAAKPGVADTPVTARRDLAKLHCRMLQQAGATLLNRQSPEQAAAHDAVCECEISPLLSYAGEGLEAVKGKTITLPAHVTPDNILTL